MNLPELDRLPTFDEMKEFFKKHDWTAVKIDTWLREAKKNEQRLLTLQS